MRKLAANSSTITNIRTVANIYLDNISDGLSFHRIIIILRSWRSEFWSVRFGAYIQYIPIHTPHYRTYISLLFFFLLHLIWVHFWWCVVFAVYRIIIWWDWIHIDTKLIQLWRQESDTWVSERWDLFSFFRPCFCMYYELALVVWFYLNCTPSSIRLAAHLDTIEKTNEIIE